jgi:hypothetical protein
MRGSEIKARLPKIFYLANSYTDTDSKDPIYAKQIGNS